MSIILTIVLVLSWVFFIFYFVRDKEFVIHSDEKELIFCHKINCDFNQELYCDYAGTKRLNNEGRCMNFEPVNGEFKITPE